VDITVKAPRISDHVTKFHGDRLSEIGCCIVPEEIKRQFKAFAVTCIQAVSATVTLAGRP